FGEMRATRHGDAPRREKFLDLVLESALQAVERHGREELTVRELFESFVRSGHAGESFDAVVPRRDVGVTDRPVDALAVTTARAEVVVAQAVGLASPGDRAAAEVISADPGVRPVGWRAVG